MDNENSTSSSSEYSKREKEISMLEYMIFPTTKETFFKEYFEKKPLLIKRKKSDYYQGLHTKDQIVAEIKTESLLYATDINLAEFNRDTRKKEVKNIIDDQGHGMPVEL